MASVGMRSRPLDARPRATPSAPRVADRGQSAARRRLSRWHCSASSSSSPSQSSPSSSSSSSSSSGPRLASERRETGEKKRLAVFASGGGSNFRAIHAAIGQGKIKGSIELLVSDKPSCGMTRYASDHGIACLTYPDKSEADEGYGRLVRALKEELRVDYILLAGYLKFISPDLVRAYDRAMLNIHPALLPSFGGKGYYGMRVHEAVVASGVRYSGATVHFVNEKYDEGRIVAQACVPVLPTDTPEDLARRVLKREHEVYPEVVAALCDGRIEWGEDGKPVIWTPL